MGNAAFCPEDGRDIRKCASAGDCPIGKHPPQVDVVAGAVGVVKATLGIDKADDAEIERRKGICAGCEHVRLLAGVVNQCDLCKCVVALKARLKSGKCPARKW